MGDCTLSQGKIEECYDYKHAQLGPGGTGGENHLWQLKIQGWTWYKLMQFSFTVTEDAYNSVFLIDHVMVLNKLFNEHDLFG